MSVSSSTTYSTSYKMKLNPSDDVDEEDEEDEPLIMTY